MRSHLPDLMRNLDRMWKKIMKNVVLYKGQGIDYVIKIAGGGVYTIVY